VDEPRRERERQRPSCEEQALRLLGSRAHFRRELQQKLARRGYGAGEIETTLERLAAAGHLDDAALARDEAARLATRKGLARRGVAAELRRKGAAAEAVDRALGATAGEDESAPARAAAERWLRTHALDAAALGRHLARKGYGQGVIFRTLNELAPGAERPSDD
jgi:regulatory protein